MPVYQRQKGGKWEIRLQIKGRKYYEQVPEAQNKEQAKVAEAQLRQKIYEGKYGREAGTTDFKDFAERVYLPSVQDRVKHPEKAKYTTRILCDYFKGKKLRDITPMLIEGFKRQRLTANSLRGHSRHPATVKGEINILSSIFNLALDNDLIGMNPCRKVRWGRGQLECKRERVLTHEEEARLIPELERYPEVKYAVLLSLNTGLRRMGILKLKDSDIDLAGQTLTYTAKGGKRQTIPLNPEAVKVIRALMEQPDGEYLFHYRKGNNLSSVRGAFDLAKKRAKIHDLRFHDLRRTFATRLLTLGVNPLVIKSLLGHADLKMTELYARTQMPSMQEAVRSLTAVSPESENTLKFPVQTHPIKVSRRS